MVFAATVAFIRLHQNKVKLLFSHSGTGLVWDPGRAPLPSVVLRSENLLLLVMVRLLFDNDCQDDSGSADAEMCGRIEQAQSNGSSEQ